MVTIFICYRFNSDLFTLKCEYHQVLIKKKISLLPLNRFHCENTYISILVRLEKENKENEQNTRALISQCPNSVLIRLIDAGRRERIRPGGGFVSLLTCQCHLRSDNAQKVNTCRARWRTPRGRIGGAEILDHYIQVHMYSMLISPHFSHHCWIPKL